MLYALNENIKKLRVARGMNQVKLAQALGVTKQCVSNWENGNVLPSIDMLVKIAEVFGVTTDHLLGREERSTLDVSELTEVQRGHVSLLIEDLARANKER